MCISILTAQFNSTNNYGILNIFIVEKKSHVFSVEIWSVV